MGQYGERIENTEFKYAPVGSSPMLSAKSKRTILVMVLLLFGAKAWDSNTTGRDRKRESPVDFRTGSGPSLLSGQAKDGRCDQREQMQSPMRNQ